MSFSMGPDNAIMTYVIGLGIVVPVFGAWTRYKINFTPKVSESQCDYYFYSC